MSDFTQEMYDESCEQFKAAVDEMVKESGCSSVAMAIAMNKIPSLTSNMYSFQEHVNPKAEKLGIKTKSLSDLFGGGIKLTVK